MLLPVPSSGVLSGTLTTATRPATLLVPPTERHIMFRFVPIQAFVAEQDLAFYVKHGVNLPSCRGALRGLPVAQREGWTVKRTAKGALLDVIALRRAIVEDWTLLEGTASAFVVEGDEAATKREQAKLRKAIRVGERLREQLAEAEITGIPVQWNGV